MIRAAIISLFVAIVGLPASGAGWPENVRTIQYESAADRSQQPAKFYAPPKALNAARNPDSNPNSGKPTPVPLLVGLHSWSGDYQQVNPGSAFAAWCIKEDWAFVGPNFRGPNRRPEACGSDLVIADILSAIDYARQHANIDPSRIYLIGASGGGHCALLMAGRKPDLWAGVSAWVPITDLAAWHAQTKKVGRKYFQDLEKSCGGAPGASKAVDEQYRQRSPLTWLDRAKGLPLDINAGIKDSGVPISHSLHAFNIVADAKDKIALDVINAMTRSRKIEDPSKMVIEDATYGDKKPLFRRSSGAARVTIFQGGHEIVTQAGLSWLSKQRKTTK